MAGVWEAQDELLGRAVAVKVLAQHLSDDDRARKRFEREARAAAGLSSHPNVVTIYDVAEHEGRAFMVMELMRGGSLADVLRRDEEISHKRALRWLREAASGLDAAHAAGVVHRDVKPANLLLDDHDRLGIGDFGIARLAWEEQVTQTGQVLGTAAYLAPEQAMGEPATAASDRYALSVVAFELLTGEKPFNAEHFAAQARAHVEDDPPRASELNPDLTDRVDAVIDRGMAKDPDDRWGSAVEFAERLDESLAAPPPRRAAKAKPAPPTRSTRLMADRDRTPPPPEPPRRAAAAADRPGRSGPGAAVLIAGLVALAAVVVAFVLLSGDGDGNKGNQTAKQTATPEAKKTSTPTPTAEKTSTPSPTATATADGDGDGDRHPGGDPGQAGRQRAGRQQPRTAPAAGLQPQPGRQVPGGAAGRAEGGPARLHARRQGEPVRLRAVRAGQGPARHRRRRGSGQDARAAPPALPRRPAGRGRGGAQEGEGRSRGVKDSAGRADSPLCTRELIRGC